MAAAKKQSNRRGTAKTTSGRKNTRKKQTRKQVKKQGVTSGFQTEIILLTILAASIILIISNLGMGGVVGAAISKASFGIMGLLAYVFPVLIFVGAAFLVSNSKNPLAYKKALAALVFFVFLCGLVQLLTEGYMSSTTMSEYYSTCSTYRTGGGVLGGAICISTTSAFGVAGGYVIIILVLLISLILITQKSFFGFVFRIWDAVCALARDGHDMYMEGQPERDLRKELRVQERRQRREERQAQRVRELEEALAQENNDGEESAAKEKKSTGFLEGTLLVPPEAKKKKNRKTVLRDHKKTAEGIKNDTATDTDSVAVVSDMTSDFAGNAEHGETVRQDQKDEMPENMPVENTMAMASPQTPMFEIHRAEPEEFYQEPSDSYVQPTAEQDVPELSECYSEPEPVETYAEVQQVQEPVSENVPESVPQPETRPASQSVKNPKSSKQEIESGIQNIQKEITQQNEVVKREYHYPPLKLLKRGDGKSQGDSDEHLRKTAKKLQDTLHNFGVNVTVTNVSCGPTVTRYELQPEMGVKVSKIVNLADDIKLNLATPDIRIEAPIPGKAAVGIEVPNKENHAVMLREILQSQEFQSAKSRLSFAVGKDIAGKPVVTDIAKMPHLLIAGATGSGKSVCINTLIVSILYKASPEDVKLIMVDPKVVELNVYNGIPHLLIPVVTDPRKAAGALNWAVAEMMKRYQLFAEYNVRDLKGFNEKVLNLEPAENNPKKMAQIVIIVDELADLMMVAPKDVEGAICRLAQLARAAGIHLILATQRPSVNVITGLIKANMPSRIAFAVSSGVDSRTIIDMNGAEKLLGKGDMLFYPTGYPKPVRVQGSFVSDKEVQQVVDYLINQNGGANYSSDLEEHLSNDNSVELSGSAVFSGNSSETEDNRDHYFADAGFFIIEKEKASIGMLQRMFKIGFNRAARIMDQLAEAQVVGPEEGTKPRKVLMTKEEFEEYLGTGKKED